MMQTTHPRIESLDLKSAPGWEVSRKEGRSSAVRLQSFQEKTEELVANFINKCFPWLSNLLSV
jgi:hypothetical protein